MKSIKAQSIRLIKEFPEQQTKAWLNDNYSQGEGYPNCDWVIRSGIFTKFRSDGYNFKKSLLYNTIPKVFNCYLHKKNGKLGYNKLKHH